MYDKFLGILDDHDMTQMVSESTRNDKVLDLLLISNPTLINKIQIIPGISDHDIVSAIVNARPTILKQKPRKCTIYSKANWPEFQKCMLSAQNDIINLQDTSTVEDLWVRFKTAIETGISKCFPVKTIGSKKALPWVTKSIV